MFIFQYFPAIFSALLQFWVKDFFWIQMQKIGIEKNSIDLKGSDSFFRIQDTFLN